MKTITAGMTGSDYLATLNNTPKVYNVKDYGALGNGSHDDTVNIQNAINACSDGGGGTVYFPNGIYIIGGALQTGGTNPNSQLYIPHGVLGSTSTKSIRLLGESISETPNFMFAEIPVIVTTGVILKSTIAGSGVLPAVIGTKGVSSWLGYYSYSDTHIENIMIEVASFNTTTGVTMSAINMIYSAYTTIKNVICFPDCALKNTILPTAHTYGLLMAARDANMPTKIDRFTAMGFWCGSATGEGCNIIDIVSWGCVIGFMSLTTTYATTINVAHMHSCKYAIAAQQDEIIGIPVGATRLFIDYFTLEPAVVGDYWASWMAFVDVILDVNNYIYGTFKGDIKSVAGVHGQNISRSNGGKNFIYTNSHIIGSPSWTTSDRPTVPSAGTTGYNLTTNKTEVWNGSTWNDLF